MDADQQEFDAAYDAPQPKRFRHQSYKQTLKEVHLPSAFKQTHLDQELGDNDSHFHEALDHWRQLNLAPSFIQFASKADPLSSSMPLLLHNWRDIYCLWFDAFKTSDDEGLLALLDLLQNMAHDLRTTLSPIYPELLQGLLDLLPRSILAPALTALLETFSSLFRYLLIPSVQFALLETTWHKICQVLPRCLSEVQRAMAEVWGSVLRRMKSASRERAVALLAQHAHQMEDASAWVVVFACKSVSQTLHTCTPSIFAPLLIYHLTTEDHETTYTLLRRAITALVHHVRTSEQFSILGNILINKFISLTNAANSPETLETLRRMTEVLAVPVSARQGSRLTDAQIKLLFDNLESVPIVPELHVSLLKYVVGLYSAGDMSMWVGPGLKFLQRTWDVSTSSTLMSDDGPNTRRSQLHFALKLNGCLADSGWGGWRMVAIPLLSKSVVKPDILEKEPKLLLDFLAKLKRGKNINPAEMDVVWRTRIEACALARLASWKEKGTVDSAAELDDILTISGVFTTGLSSTLIEIITKALSATPAFIGGAYNSHSAWVLGSSLQALAKREPSEWSTSVNLSNWVIMGAQNWGWSHDVLGSLVVVIQASSVTTRSVKISEIYPSLKDSLLSHSRPLRLACLRLLDSKIVNYVDGPVEVLKRCIQGEEVPLDLQGVRERVLRIGRVCHVVGDEKGADLCARWLIAQLKVSLRPLWSPSASALSSLSTRFGDIVWRLLFAELQKASKASSLSKPETNQGSALEAPSDEDPWEDERSWRDPSAHNVRVVVIEWNDDEFNHKRILKEQDLQERFDLSGFESQLLSSLEECASLTEKHNRDIIPHFIQLGGETVENIVSKIPKPKLVSWLTLFSKFANPKALSSTDTLKALYTRLLSHPDRQLQTLALSCLLGYKSPALGQHEDRLRALLDDTRWRDELTLLNLEGLDPMARPEVLDVVIRLLFGVMLEKRGRSRGADRRAAVLSVLAGCRNGELSLLVDLMVGPLGTSSCDPGFQPGKFQISLVNAAVSDKQLTGFLTLLGDVLKNLGSRLVSYWPTLLGTTINVLHTAQTRIHEIEEDDGSNRDPQEKDREDDEEEEEEEEQEATGSPSAVNSKITRSIRQLGLKRLADFFRIPVTFEFSPYLEPAFTSFISPRLPVLDKENTQAPSALLELFYVWTTQSAYVHYIVAFDHDTLPKIYDCLVATNVKPSVVLRIFDIVENLLRYSAEDEDIRDSVLKPHVSRLLNNLATLVGRTKGSVAASSTLYQRQVSILSEIAQYSTDAFQAAALIDLFSPLLRQQSKVVPERVKMNLIKIIGELLHLLPDLSDTTTTTYTKTYTLIALLFQTLRSRQSRIALVATFHKLASIAVGIQPLAELMEGLNAWSLKRVDEPDFEKRMSAFTTLNETMHLSLSPLDWLPIIYNMLNFIQDHAELSIRSNAAFTMRHFLDRVAARVSDDYDATFFRVLYPGLKNGLRSKTESVRAEILGVIAYAVEHCQHIPSMTELRVLLEGGDPEANFFNNILHIQVHRRSRALRRLGEHCDEGHLRSSTLADIFVPLVGNYLISTKSVDHHLVTDAIQATGKMAKQLNWAAYYSLVQKYIKLSRRKDESEKVYIRTLVALLDNFHFSMEEVVEDVKEGADDKMGEEDAEVDEEAMEVDTQEPAKPVQSAEMTAKIADAVNLRLLPSLLNHLEKYDANTDDNTRIPIAIGIVTVAKHLPSAAREAQITRLVTILSQILRSKSQETRDLVRDSLNRIAVSIGPTYLPVIVKELRGALLRGPQLHVLATVVHGLIVHVTTGAHASTFGCLDSIVDDVAHVSAEVIFGESGKDVQSEEFKTKMREVRGSASRGYDTFSLISRFITPGKISAVLVPIRAIMHQTEALKVLNVVDEVLKRITLGLNSNLHLVPAELLTLCNTLVNQNAKFLQQIAPRQKKGPKQDALVQTKRTELSEQNHYAHNSYRFVAFGLDLLNTALRRRRFDFKDANVLSRLESIVPVVGNTLYSTNAAVLTLGLRCTAGLAVCPLKAMEKAVPVVVRQTIEIVKQAGNTDSELVQVTFKSLATVLRDGPPVQVKEKDLVFLLELVTPDLEEPSRQASVFALLRAIVSRKFVVPEIYDLMEKVSEISVVSQSPQVQELCRNVLLQFLLDYPQGKGRLRTQMAFFAKNLNYIHESGRLSIMEVLGALISKFTESLVFEYADMLFVALVMVVANDESAKCREQASQLIKSLYIRLDQEKQKTVMSHLHTWASQTSRPQLTWVSSQIAGFLVDAAQNAIAPYVGQILDDLMASLRMSNATIAFAPDSDDENQMDVELEWQLPYYALTVLSKIIRVFPEFSTDNENVAWNLVVSHLLFPHAWVRTTSCRLLGVLYSAVPVALPRSDLPADHPLSRIGMQQTARNLTEQLKSKHLEEMLGLQIVKNLFYIGKCFSLIPPAEKADVEHDAEDLLVGDASVSNDVILANEGQLKELSNPLPWLFSKLSYQIRSAHIARRSRANAKVNWSQQPLSGLRWFAAMVSYMDTERTEQFLVHILTPVYRLTEDDTIKDTQMEELKTTATELQDLVQGKVGPTKFSNVYNQIRQGVLGVRKERKVARTLQVANNPEVAAKRRIQRNLSKKESKKRKERSSMDGKGKPKRFRQE